MLAPYELIRVTQLNLKLPFDRFARLFAPMRSLLDSATPAARVQGLHDVLRLEVTGSAGHTPAAYGWHVDDLLQVRLRMSGEPSRELPAVPDAHPDDEHPGRGELVDPTPNASGYRVRSGTWLRSSNLDTSGVS